MTSEYERGHAAGREAGIREAADKLASFGLSSGIEWKTYRAILALLDAPAPAGVTVQEAAKLADAVWSEYSGSIKDKWTFRKEHVENAILRALSEAKP